MQTQQKKEITQEVASQVLNVVDQGPRSSKYGDPMHPRFMSKDQPTFVSAVFDDIHWVCLSNRRWSNDKAQAKGLRRLAIAQLGTEGTLDKQLLAEKLNELVIKKMFPKVLRSAASFQKEPHKSKLMAAANQCETKGNHAAVDTARIVAMHARWTAIWSDAARLTATNIEDAAQFAAAWWVEPPAAAAANAASAARWANSVARLGDISAVVDAAGVAACTTLGVDDAITKYAIAIRWAVIAFALAAAYNTWWWRSDAASDTANDQFLSEFAEGVVQILLEMKTPGSQFLFLTQHQQ